MQHLRIVSSLQDFQRDERQAYDTSEPKCIRTDSIQNTKKVTYYVLEKEIKLKQWTVIC